MSISAMSARTIIWLGSPISNSTVPPDREVPEATISPASTSLFMTTPLIGARTRTSSSSAFPVRAAAPRLALVSRISSSSSARRRLLRARVRARSASSNSLPGSMRFSNRVFLRA